MEEELKPFTEDGDIGAGPSTHGGSEVRHRQLRRCDSPGIDSPLLEKDEEAPQSPHSPSGDGDPNSTLENFWHRAGWLVLLLLCQSTSSVILEHFEALIRTHPIVIYFLTMLVGAGGNAGSQSTVLVVRRLAVSCARGDRQSTSWSSVRSILAAEVSVGARLAIVLFAASFVRCICFQVRGLECLAICLSMLCITFSSTLIGATLPLLLKRLGFDPAHAGAAIQVIMDISGVSITCVISCAILGVKVGVAAETAIASNIRPPPAGIQHEGVYELNSFGSFSAVPEVDFGR